VAGGGRGVRVVAEDAMSTVISGRSRSDGVTLYYHADGTWRGTRETALHFVRAPEATAFVAFTKVHQQSIRDITVEESA
jgi:hypothetical protein